MKTEAIKLLEGYGHQLIEAAKNGEDISGHNGPYRDDETPVRGLAHLAVLLSNLDEEKKSLVNRDMVSTYINTILTSTDRLSFQTFIQRKKPGKDEVNGVIGIAWIIEAMCCAYQTYGLKEAKEFLEQIEDHLHFKQSRALWTRPVQQDNKYYNTVDETFNHQLWLGYALVFKAHVLQQPLSANVKAYFNNIHKSFEVYNSGIVVHSIHYANGIKGKIKNSLKAIRDGLRISLMGQTKQYKETGYHLFNMYAFARIAHLGHGNLFVNSPKFKKALKFTASPKLYQALMQNKDTSDFYRLEPSSGLPFNRYGFPYNVAGFEFLYVAKVFNLDVSDTLTKNYWDTQLTCYGITAEGKSETYLTEDKANLLLRSYELSYFVVD